MAGSSNNVGAKRNSSTIGFTRTIWLTKIALLSKSKYFHR